MTNTTSGYNEARRRYPVLLFSSGSRIYY